MKNLIREFILLRRGERRALVSVTIFLLLAAVLRIWISSKPVSEFEPDSSFITAMEDIELELKEAPPIPDPSGQERKQKRPVPEQLQPFRFDPNRISYDSLRLMHIPVFVAGNIVSYRRAGGVFRTPESLLNIYGMDSVLFAKLLPHIRITTVRDNTAYPEHDARPEPEIAAFDLNSADSSLIEMLPEISPWFAARIIKYREMLGGYYDTLQFWEIYGMDSVRYKVLRNYCYLDTQNIMRLDINRASFRELIRHPYIDRRETYAILQFREFRDSIFDPGELLMNQIIDHDRFMRMRPYFNKN